MHPNPERLKEMADKFTALHMEHNLTSENVDFNVIALETHACGTVACHGGWAAVALNQHIKCTGPGCWEFDCATNEQDYMDGAHALSDFLFDKQDRGAHSILWWANDNPHRWGNTHGVHMFSENGHAAFGTPHPTLLDIAEHYRAVADRIVEANAGRMYALSAGELIEALKKVHPDTCLTIDADDAGGACEAVTEAFKVLVGIELNANPRFDTKGTVTLKFLDDDMVDL